MRGVIALAARTQRPQLLYLAQLHTRTNLAHNDDDLHEHLDPSELRINDLDVSIDHEITISGRIAVPEPGTASTWAPPPH